MPTSQLQNDGGSRPAQPQRTPEPKYGLTFVDEPFILVSLYRSIRAWLKDPKITVPQQYYRGEVKLPVTEMRPWYRDFRYQIRALWEKQDLSRLPQELRDGILKNQVQEKRRALMALGSGLLGAALGFLLGRVPGIGIGLGSGYITGYLVSVLLFKKVEVFRDIWQDYEQQPASWFNSVLVHAVIILAMAIPYIISVWMTPTRAKAEHMVAVDISPYLPDLPSPKKSGGGGGGGDRTPTPASKGPIPKFSKIQFTPPVTKILNPDPKLPAAPTLLGPPDLKLPQMQASITFGDPLGVNGPTSNGPGTGGGIGSGEGTGVGSGSGGGLGPGSGGGTGGGIYSVGGGVSEPIPIYKPEPPYSEEARKAKFQGTVVLMIVIDAQGNVSEAHVVRRLGLGLDENAEQTVKTWKFKPALRGGSPVPVRVLVEVSFRLF